MVVKSATKKRLMDLGIAEELAHKLSDDRKWSEVSQMQLDDIQFVIGGSQFSAMVIYLRIQFRTTMMDFFRNPAGVDSRYGGLVAIPRSISSLQFRDDMPNSGIIINRRHLGIGRHDYDQLMLAFRQRVPVNWIKTTDSVNDQWYPEYYEEWVRHQRRLQEEALNK